MFANDCIWDQIRYFGFPMSLDRPEVNYSICESLYGPIINLTEQVFPCMDIAISLKCIQMKFSVFFLLSRMKKS